MSDGFSLPSFAKINWTLRILGKREDGYHELFTIFQTVSLQDTISFAEDGELALTADTEAVPTDDGNLIIKAARALQQEAGITRGARLHLEKRIPSPGGLGGGSSNAATALIGLSRLWNIDPEPEVLTRLASEIGSDVPFFLHGGTAIGTGRGETIEEAGEIEESFLLIVTPDISVSTAEAYGSLNAPSLTTADSNRILRVCRLEAGSLDPHHSVLINDLERNIFARYPEIERVKETLLGLGAVNAAMSGSGASVFAIFDKKETRQAAQKALEQESTWRKFAVSTVSRSAYREALRC